MSMVKLSFASTPKIQDLSPQIIVPVEGAWKRYYASEKRSLMLQQAFSIKNMLNGSIFVLSGPRGSGKSAAALAACDLRNFEAVYAYNSPHHEQVEIKEGQCIIIDPVSAFETEELQQLVEDYRGKCPIILIDRVKRPFETIFENIDNSIANKEIIFIGLKPPSSQILSGYLKELLAGYSHSLQENDYIDLGRAMNGMSIPQASQVIMDAALSKMQHSEVIDRSCFDIALTNWNRMKQSKQSL